VKSDLDRVRSARAGLLLKDRADTAMRHALVGGKGEAAALEVAADLYTQAVDADPEASVVLANRCFAHLRAGQPRECLADADVALQSLKQWPTAQRPPKGPARPTRLDPPYLDDPTFKHPDEKKDELDWLMKHGGGTKADLPPLPPEYEWVKDVAEKGDNSWIALRKKMSKATIDAIKRATAELQDAMYTRRPQTIRDQIVVAIDQNRQGEGPSSKAIRQAEEYAQKLEDYEKEKEAERQQLDAELRQEFEECDLQESLAPRRSGVAQAGFGRGHPVQRTRRRLLVKVLLRRARAFELLGDCEACMADLRAVLHVEPENPEAQRRLQAVTALLLVDEATDTAPASAVAEATTEVQPETTPELEHGPQGPAPAASPGLDDIDDDDDKPHDRAAPAALLSSAAEYMRRNDYASALQIYSYARKLYKDWDSPLEELKVLSNTSLCLQRLRGRLPELISACDEALERIAEVRETRDESVSEQVLLHMECACLSRRGSAHSQLGHASEGSRDAVRVRELLAQDPARTESQPEVAGPK